MSKTIESLGLKIHEVSIDLLKPAEYNPRTHDAEAARQLKESLTRFGFVDPVICNSAPQRKNIIIGGHFRVEVAKELGIKIVPVVYIRIDDITKEKELNLRLNKNTGEFDFDLLAKFDESFLADIGFTSEELDNIFPEDEVPEIFDLKKELEKLDIKKISVKKGDVYDFNGSRIMCGDSTVESDILKLMSGEKASMVMTDPPYRLQYLRGKSRNGQSTTGFGMKKNRRYLETDSLPEDFTKLWMENVAKVQAKDFAIVCYENWKNLREVWGEMERHWQVRNMLVWHLPNRNQGYAAKHKFFSKHDIAMLGTSSDKELNLEDEGELLQNEFETALFAINGNPHWEGYKKGGRYCPTDFIQYNAADEKSSGQSVIFGVKPVEILLPYIKVLTKRSDLVLEPFGGSGSTAATALKLHRRFCVMEKSNIYTTIILRRIERLTGITPKKL